MTEMQKMEQTARDVKTTRITATKPGMQTAGRRSLEWSGGLLLTLMIALLATWLAQWPFFSFMGPMILAILIGMGLRPLLPTAAGLQAGIAFSSKSILRLGIILLGLRLNLQQIASAGMAVLGLDLLVIMLTIPFMWWLGKQLQIHPTLRTLLAVGTAICGAAAIVAVAPILRARPERVAVAVAYIAMTGTFFAIGYSILYTIWQPSPVLYGAFVGATLHEVAHVVAAGAVGGPASADMAILVKLGRVLLLMPVVFLFLWREIRKQDRDTHAATQATQGEQKLKQAPPIPWFIFGFLGMATLQTLLPLPASWTRQGIQASTLFLAMGMAGLGLGVHVSVLKKGGFKLGLFAFLGTLGTLVAGLCGVLIGFR